MSEPVDKLVRAMNLRGNASSFAADDRETKKLVEASVAQDWAKAMGSRYSLQVTQMRLNDDDPPDALCRIDGRDIAVELTELVDGTFLAKAKLRNRTQLLSGSRGRLTAASAEGLSLTRWNRERFLEQIGRCISRKVTSYKARHLRIETLVIFTGEFWLSPEDAENWLTGCSFESEGVFEACYLLFDYRPEFSNVHYPLLELNLT